MNSDNKKILHSSESERYYFLTDRLNKGKSKKLSKRQNKICLLNTGLNEAFSKCK